MGVCGGVAVSGGRWLSMCQMCVDCRVVVGDVLSCVVLQWVELGLVGLS